MRTWLVGGTRFVFVVVGIIVLTSFTIDATDALRGSQSALSILARSATEAGCPAGTVLFEHGETRLCVDVYEASPGASCPQLRTQSVQATTQNIASPSCTAVSEANREPWRYVNYTEAKQLCARSGKRLLSNTEWYELAVGISDISTCTLTSSAQSPNQTGSGCSTPGGVADMVGNVWEWTNDTVTDGQYAGRVLPESGYVSLVDGSGIVIETSAEQQAGFNNDYAWVNTTGVRGFLRGGFYGSGEDGGIFAQNMSVGLDFAAVGVGFRCVKNL